MNTTTHAYELSITRIIAAPPQTLFKVWTEQLPQWWGPHGMTTPVCEMELRPGGVLRTVMRDAEGNEYPTLGVFLELTAPERIVFTDAYGPGWQPSEKPFITAISTFDPLPDGTTRYTTRALHWTEEACKAHEAMGFYDGWGQSMERFEQCVLNMR